MALYVAVTTQDEVAPSGWAGTGGSPFRIALSDLAAYQRQGCQGKAKCR